MFLKKLLNGIIKFSLRSFFLLLYIKNISIPLDRLRFQISPEAVGGFKRLYVSAAQRVSLVFA